MKVIGIIGGIGAGKTTVVKTIQSLITSEVISADEIGHLILKKGQEAYQPVIEAFGEDILDENGEIVRRRLGKKVFGDEKALKKLNEISHPLIYQTVKRQIEDYQKEGQYEWVLIDAALLIEIGLINLVEKVIGVYAEPNIRAERIMKREGISLEDALKRIKSQKKWEELEKVCDDIIDNNGIIEVTKAQIQTIIIKYQRG